MADQWFYSQEGQQYGPMSTLQIKNLATAGELQPNDLLWKEGLESWIPANRLKGLFGAETPENETLGLQAGGRGDTVRQRPFAVAFQILMSTIGKLLLRFPTYACVTLLWYFATILTGAGIITVPLTAAFTIGYVAIIQKLSHNHPYTLQELIGFFRRGWDSLFDLLMLVACAVVILAVALLATSLFVLFVSVILFLGSGHQYPIVSLSIAAVSALSLLALIHGSMILLFCLFIKVENNEPDAQKRFDFIYDAFGETLALLANRWGTLASAGILLTLFQVIVGGLFGLVISFLGIATGVTGGSTSIGMIQIGVAACFLISLFSAVFFLAYTMLFYVRIADHLVQDSSAIQKPRSA